MRTRRAFTLIELLVSIVIVGILATIGLAAAGQMRRVGQRAACANSLRQLGAAVHLYLGDNDNVFFPFSAYIPEGRLWYFGLERSSGTEGTRDLDVTRSYLYPYLHQVGGVEVCPSFPYESALWKQKFKGASYGYGYNLFLPGRNLATIENKTQVLIFADCAQINTFQAPASAKNPMIEEFYMINNWYQTIHFRHGAVAQAVFIDGHVEGLTMQPGTLDQKLPQEKVGRFSPPGSMLYLY